MPAVTRQATSPTRPTPTSESGNVADITTVLDDLNIPQAHYFGYSMGGRIGFAIARYAPKRVHSLVIGGGSPYAQSPIALDRILDWRVSRIIASLAINSRGMGLIAHQR